MIKVEKKRSRTHKVATALIAFVATLATFSCSNSSETENVPSEVSPKETIIQEETSYCVNPYENNMFSIAPGPIYENRVFSKLVHPHILSDIIQKLAYNSATSLITPSSIDTSTSTSSNKNSMLELVKDDVIKKIALAELKHEDNSSKSNDIAVFPDALNFEKLSELTVIVNNNITEVTNKLTGELMNYNDEGPSSTDGELGVASNPNESVEVIVEENSYVEEIPEESIEGEETEEIVSYYIGPVLTAWAGSIEGPSGKETYYNLDMTGVISIMRGIGNNDPYWVRPDGVKMLGDYVMIAANLNIRPRGSYVETSLGMGIVCDTGGFADVNEYQIDIATTW